MNTSTLLIQSQQQDNYTMGTGFVIHQDSFGSYVLTCAHVIEEVKVPKIDGFDVEVKSKGSKETLDLALLYVKGLFKTPFELQMRQCETDDVQLIGFSLFSKDKYQGKIRDATILGDKVTLKGISQGTEYAAWQIVTKNKYEIEHGNSGGPLLCQKSGKVIGVMSNNKDGKYGGYAIAIEHLRDIWEDIPPFLFESDDENESPFVGLSAFGIEQSHLFFGREQETQEIIEKLKKEDLIAVVGDSGSGKSSVIKAGVIPQYLNGSLDGEEDSNFYLIDTRPAKNPFNELSYSMSKIAEEFKLEFNDINQIKIAIRSKNSESVLNGLEQIFKKEHSTLLIYIDQFEELFTLCEDEVQKEFIEVLLYLLNNQTSNLRIKIIFTMRRDYYNLISEYEEFFQLTQASKYTLRRMQNEQIKECIEKPLERTFIPKERIRPFAKAVLQDMGDKSSELALLQIALTQTWKHKQDYENNLLRTYHEIGEVSGALAKLAQDTWSILDPIEQRILKYIFIRIIQPGETGGVTRRLADKEEFSEDAWHLAQKLSSALDSNGNIASEKNARLGRLLKIKGKDGKVVELTHEALVGQWPMYQRWLKEVNKNHLKRIHDRVIEKTKSYQLNQKKKFLLMGYELEESMKLLEDGYRDYLSADEIAYIEKSCSQEKMSNLKKRILRFGLVLLTLTSIYFWMSVENKKDEVDSLLQRNIIEKGILYRDKLNEPLKAKLLFAQALSQDIKRADVIADESLKILYNSLYDVKLKKYIVDNNQSEVELLDSNRYWDVNISLLKNVMKIRKDDNKTNRGIKGSRISHDKNYLLLWQSNFVELWNVKDNNLTFEYKLLFDGVVKDAIFSSDDTKIAARSFLSGKVEIWRREDGTILSIFNDALNRHFPNTNGIQFSKNGKELLYWGGDKNFLKKENPISKIFLADINNESETKLYTHDVWAYGATFRNNEKEVWSWGADKSLKIFDRKEKRLRFQLYNREAIYKTVFKNSQEEFNTYSLNGKVKKEWFVRNKIEKFDLKHEVNMIGIVFSKDGKRFFSWDRRGLIKVWDRKRFIEIGSFSYDEYVWGAKFSKDEKYIVAWNRLGIVKKWDSQTFQEIEGNYPKVKRVKLSSFVKNNKKISWKKNILTIKDLESNEEKVFKHDSEVRGESIHFNRAQTILLSCDQNSINLWDLKSKILILKLEHKKVIDAKFSDNEKKVISWGYNSDMKIFKLYKDRSLDVKNYLLEAEVQSGAKLHHDEIKPLSFKEWKERETAYKKIIKKSQKKDKK